MPGLRRLLAALALLPAAGGCERETERRSATEAAGPAPAALAKTPSEAELAGDWVVAAVNGIPMPSRETILVQWNAGSIQAQSGCVPFAWRYTRSGATLRTTDGLSDQPVCERGRSGWETGFDDAFGASPSVGLLGDGTLRVQGPGGSVALSRPGAPTPATATLAKPVADCVQAPSAGRPVHVATVRTPAGTVRLLRSGACGGDGAYGAPLGGRLVLRDGCLEVDQAQGRPLIWPAETRLDLVPASGELRLVNIQGEAAVLGGYVGMYGGPASPDALAAVPAPCAGGDPYAASVFFPCPDCATPSRPGVQPSLPPLPPPPPPPPLRR